MRDRWLQAQKHEADFYRDSQRLMPLQTEVWHCSTGNLLEIGGREHMQSSIGKLKVVLDPMPWASDDYVQGVEESIPLKDKSISECYMINTIDHCAEPKAVLREIGRILQPNGGLEISCNTFHPWVKPLFPILNKLDGPHPWHFSLGSFTNLVTNSGFILESCYSWKPQPKGQRHLASSLKVVVARMFGLKHIVLRCHVKNATVSC